MELRYTMNAVINRWTTQCFVLLIQVWCAFSPIPERCKAWFALVGTVDQCMGSGCMREQSPHPTVLARSKGLTIRDEAMNTIFTSHYKTNRMLRNRNGWASDALCSFVANNLRTLDSIYGREHENKATRTLICSQMESQNVASLSFLLVGIL